MGVLVEPLCDLVLRYLRVTAHSTLSRSFFRTTPPMHGLYIAHMPLTPLPCPPIFADTILPIPLPQPLTYRIPSVLVGRIVQGSRVLVPLGVRKCLTGIVDKVHSHTPATPTKQIIALLDEVPVISPQQLYFFHWLAAYYVCTIGEIIRAALPNGFRRYKQAVIQLNPHVVLSNMVLTPQEQLLVDALKDRKKLTYAAAAEVDPQNIHTLIQSLLHKKVILFLGVLKKDPASQQTKRIRLDSTYLESPTALQNLWHILKRKPKQYDVLSKYTAHVQLQPQKEITTHWIDKKIFTGTGISATSLQTLIKKKIFVEKSTEVTRYMPQRLSTATVLPTLSAAQGEALTDIQHQFQKRDIVLLHGAIASSRTAVYLPLIQEVLQRGGQVLYLLPEISLTTQVVCQWQRVFGGQISVYHSRYTDRKRIEIWYQLLRGACSLVLGTRAAIFLPFLDLQLVIIDQEHENYKQSDTIPRYHARDAALALAQQHCAKVLLGSATPSIESYYHAQQGKYGFVVLQERVDATLSPEVMLVDVRIAQQQKNLREDFTNVLLTALQETLAQQDQALLLQNRRGYVSHITCAMCAWVPMCIHCAVSLVYHHATHGLYCHYCGYHIQVPAVCDACNSPQLNNVGFGTEKLTETLQLFFPNKNIHRIDLDTTRKKDDYDKIREAVSQGDTDILVGTQMLAKGLDVSRVLLVGVLDIDRLLHFPDFRAHERCFQLLTKVLSWAGTDTRRGKVIVQTKNPQHPILQDILANDYESMYRRELQDRQQFGYPPYVRLVKITLKHSDQQVVHAAAHSLADDLKEQLQQGVLGPQVPLIAKMRNQYAIDIWVKIKKDTIQRRLWAKKTIAQLCHQLLRTTPYKKTKVVLDVDPL